MAAPSLSTFFLFISLCALCALVSPSLSLTCTSQKFTNNKVYANCSDLPKLGAYLHYTYDAANSSLSIAFVAKPDDGGAWVAWAINPTGTGMPGSQALMALKTSDGSVLATTYNISSHSSLVESKLSFDVWDLSAVEVNGTMMIFAAVKVPENATSVNQVWQVGGAVSGTMPTVHSFNAENKQSFGPLAFVTSSSTDTGNGTVTNPSPAPSASGIRRVNVGLFCGLVLLVASVISF